MKKILIIFIAFFAVNTFALNADQEGALQETKQVLRNPQQRADVIKNDHSARSADDSATIATMGNKDYKEEMYNISAELMDWVAIQQDPQTFIKRYQQDPEKFLREMPEAQAAKIKALANSIEQKRNNRAPASVTQP